jgi:hypothetical protein
MKDYARATREPFINIHFCGSESATQWQGYMDGALESGERVANEILHVLFGGNNNKIDIDYDKTYFAHRQIIKDNELRNNNKKRSGLFTSILKKSAIILPIIGYASYYFKDQF